MDYSCVVRNIKEQTYWTVVVMMCIVAPILLTIISYFGLVQQISKVQNTVRTIGNKSNGKQVLEVESNFCLVENQAVLHFDLLTYSEIRNKNFYSLKNISFRVKVFNFDLKLRLCQSCSAKTYSIEISIKYIMFLR